MGGTSSNDQKVNQLNKNMNQQLLANVNKNSKKNSPNNSKNNSPRQINNNMQNYVQNHQIKNNQSKFSKKSLNSQQKQINYNISKTKSKQSKKNQSRLSKVSQINRIRSQKIGNQFLLQKNEIKINVELSELFPNNIQGKFQQFTNIERKLNNYEAVFNWHKDKSKKIWTFNLIQNNKLAISFEVDQQNKLINGEDEGDKWLLLCPTKQNGQIKRYKQYFICQTIYQNYDDIKDANDIDIPASQKQLGNQQKEKVRICAKWDEQYISSYVKFTNNKKNTRENQKSNNKCLKSQNYCSLTKYYSADSNKWLLSSFILQQNNIFKSWLVWNQIQQNEEQNQQKIKQIEQLIQKQSKIIKLKMDVYIYKMKKKIIQNNQRK